MFYGINSIIHIVIMSTQIDLTNKNNNLIVAPDYDKIASSNTVGIIFMGIIPYLFPKDKKLTLYIFLRNISLIIFLKKLLEDTDKFLDNFKFTNLNYINYLRQKFYHSETIYEFILVASKWTHNEKTTISSSLFTTFMERKSISINNPGTYYYTYRSYIIKVIVTSNKISFHTPNIVSISTYMEDVVRENQEILLGNRTVMNKIIVSDRDIMQLSSLEPSYTFETKNYKKLYKNLSQFFEINNLLKMKQTPLVYAFNGPIGTGKTSFGSYIANKGEVDKIFLYNMVQQSTKDFKSIVGDINTLITRASSNETIKTTEKERVIIMLDEIDTYVDSFITKTIDNLRTESRKKTETKSGQNQSETTINTFEKMSEENERDKRISLREEFLSTLYNLCEGLCLKDNKQYIIICITNNFDSMFVGCSEGYNYVKIKDRFQRYEYENLKKAGVIAFLDGIKQTIASKSQNYIEELVNFDPQIYDSIDDNISISYRNLSKLLVDNNHKIVDTIKNLPNATNELNTNENSGLKLNLNVI